MKEVPDENAGDAEVVAEMAKSLIENATKEKPNKKLIEISAEGLKKAAKDLAIIIPSVLLISEKLISTVPWDDAGAFLRFSVTFMAKDQAQETQVLTDLANRLSDLTFEFAP